MRLVIQLVPNLDEFFLGGGKNFFAESIAFFAPKSNLIMRPPPQKGDTHTPPYIVTGCRAAVFWLLDTYRKEKFFLGGVVSLATPPVY